MRLFKDKTLKESVMSLDLGVVSAGENKQFTFYVQNDTKAKLRELKFSVAHPEVSIITSPQTLESNETAPLVLEWAPSVTLREGLKANLDVQGEALYG